MIAGGGRFPVILIEAARKCGVKQIVCIGFPGQTAPTLGEHVDRIFWMEIGQLGKVIKTFKREGVKEAVFAGSISPNLVVRKLKLDLRMLSLAARVRDRKAETVLKAIGEEFVKDGIELIDSTSFLRPLLPDAGVLSKRAPDKRESRDIEFGWAVAKKVADIGIGQTIVVKNGAVGAVEAMEGTSKAIARGGDVGGSGSVVIKVAKPGHDMRFDVPVIGPETIRTMAKSRATAIVVEAGKTLLLDREEALQEAAASGIAVVARA